jgi:hypothetical protein
MPARPDSQSQPVHRAAEVCHLTYPHVPCVGMRSWGQRCCDMSQSATQNPPSTFCPSMLCKDRLLFGCTLVGCPAIIVHLCLMTFARGCTQEFLTTKSKKLVKVPHTQQSKKQKVQTNHSHTPPPPNCRFPISMHRAEIDPGANILRH